MSQFSQTDAALITSSNQWLTFNKKEFQKNEPIREQFYVNRNIDIIEAKVPKNTLNQTLAMVVYCFDGHFSSLL